METNDKQGGHNLSDFSSQISAAAEAVAGSIVAIDARPRVATSGVVWREAGVLVSTNHTIRRDDNITVALADGQTAAATLIGRDEGSDLAVLKIDDAQIAESLKPAEITETSEIKVGNIVLAIGRTSAEANAMTASFGIISQIGGAWRTWRGDEIERFITLDLMIRLGFSGGALIDAGGRVLGINTSAFGRGLALTIPSETVNRVVDQILTKGKIAKPYLGIGVAQAVPITQNLRERLNIEQASGLMILTTEAGEAAEKAGMLIGDVLLSLDDRQTLEATDVLAALGGREVGSVVVAKLLRGGEIIEMEITLGERPRREQHEGRRNWRGGRRGCR
jgi:S1-C subfamily serine protease